MTFNKDQLEAIMAELNKISALSDHTKDTILSNLEKEDKMTWNKEQIAAAWNKVNGQDGGRDMTDRALSDVLSFLTKPAPVFKIDEVVIHMTNGFPIHWKSNSMGESMYRHLTPAEVPALALAMERFKILETSKLMDTGLIDIGGIKEFAKTALDDVEELL